MELAKKLEILADAAKYDASCASSGAGGRSSKGKTGIGSTTGTGICHSYTPDGRCISLLKVLLTNFCIYDCRYCINRSSSAVRRARFSVNEIVRLTLDFYRRNYIEGLFLSSGIIQSSDYTMEQLNGVARCLREEHDFQGYIHLKTIPDADEALIADAARYADRVSINIELPTAVGLKQLAPEKSWQTIHHSMGKIRDQRTTALAEFKEQRQSEQRISSLRPRKLIRASKAKRALPAGQSTQMIVGADGADDRAILSTASELYGGFQMRRVYYSAFSPIPDASDDLPPESAPLLREHRLYQADWLMRFYGFTGTELTQELEKSATPGMLDLNVDPKMAWAIRHPEFFPVDVNRACKNDLLRIPGVGPRNAERMVRIRRHRKLTYHDLLKLRVPLKRSEAFLCTADFKPGQKAQLACRTTGEQLQLF